MAKLIVADDDTEDHVSQDSLFGGDLQCFQATHGYRYSVDSILIAHFVRVHKNDRILDLGTGCGIIMLVLLYRWKEKINEIVGVEAQKNLSTLAKKNLQINNFETIGRIIDGDVKDIASLVKPESFDTVVCNPPFYGSGSGRQSVNLQARLARHQILANLDDFLFASSIAVRNKGLVYFIYPAEQIAALMSLLSKHRLEAKKLQFIYSYPKVYNDARLVLIECSKNGGAGTKILAPLFIYSEKNGLYTEDVQRFYNKK